MGNEKKPENLSLSTKILLFCGAVGSIAGLTGQLNVNQIPKVNDTQVEDGYISPNRVQVKSEDNNYNGKFETIFQVDEKKYLLREEDGRPVLYPYEVKPAKILPRR